VAVVAVEEAVAVVVEEEAVLAQPASAEAAEAAPGWRLRPQPPVSPNPRKKYFYHHHH